METRGNASFEAPSLPNIVRVVDMPFLSQVTCLDISPGQFTTHRNLGFCSTALHLSSITREVGITKRPAPWVMKGLSGQIHNPAHTHQWFLI